MSRPKRIKSLDKEMCYHLISKTAGGYFFLSPSFVKEKFINIMNTLLKGFCFNLEAYAILDNHFHILIKTKNVFEIDDKEILKRSKDAGIYKNLILNEDIEKLRKRLGDISEFMKMLKEKFSKWYNKTFDRKGYFWGGRFKSVLIEDGIAFNYCKDYIEMNPVRAGIVENPSDYKFSSCYNKKENIDQKLIPQLKIKNILLENGLIFGSLTFIKNFHKNFKNRFNLKKSKKYSNTSIKYVGDFSSYINFKEVNSNKKTPKPNNLKKSKNKNELFP